MHDWLPGSSLVQLIHLINLINLKRNRKNSMVLLTCGVVYWRHIDVMTSTHLNQRPCDARQTTLRHRDVVVIVTVAVRIWQTFYLQDISILTKEKIICQHHQHFNFVYVIMDKIE